MDKEEIDYILKHSSHLMNENESLAWRHYSIIAKQGKKDIIELTVAERRRLKNWLTNKQSALELLSAGIEKFKEKVAIRILSDHGETTVFNYCPKCKMLTRTPKSKQCRYCYHNWH